MKNFKVFLFVLLASLVFLGSANAEEKNYCPVYEHGVYVVTADKVNDFEEYLKERVYNLNNGKDNIGDYWFSYTMNVKTEDATEKTDVKTVNVSNKFSSEEDAKKYYDEVTVEAPYVKGDYAITSTDEEKSKTVEDGSIICTSLDCKDEILDLESKLGLNQKLVYDKPIYNYVDGTKTETVTYKDKNGVVYFDSEAEAQAFADQYKPTKEGYRFVKNEVERVSNSTKVSKTYEELKGNNSFDTYEEASKALESFKAEYDVTSSGIDVVRDNTEDSKTYGTETFDSKEQADKWISENSIDSSKGELITDPSTSTVRDDESDITGEYASLEDAQAALDALKAQGYILENANITEVPGKVTGEVVNGTKIDESNSVYTFAESTDYVVIKQGKANDKIAVWTKDELSEEEQNKFIESYKEKANDNSSESATTIKFISGFDITFDLGKEFNATNWGTYTFSLKDNQIVLNTQKGKVSHVVYGNLVKESPKYVLSGTKYKEKTIYEVKWTKVIYGFDYKINAVALVEVPDTKYQVVTTFINQVKQATLKYSILETYFEKMYELKYDTYIPNVIKVAYINWTITKCNNQGGNTGDNTGVEDTTDNTNSNKGNIVVTSRNYPNPPQTGVQVNTSMISYILIGAGLLISYKLYKTVKNN